MRVTRAEVEAETVALLRFAGFHPTLYFQMALDELFKLGYFTLMDKGVYERAENIEMTSEFVKVWMDELVEAQEKKDGGAT